MKSKLFVFLAVVAALVAGFFLGRFQAGHAWSKYHNAFIMSEAKHSTADFSHADGLLLAMRRDTNVVIETSQDILDTQMMMMGSIVEETPVAEREKWQVSRISWPEDTQHFAYFFTLETNR